MAQLAFQFDAPCKTFVSCKVLACAITHLQVGEASGFRPFFFEGRNYWIFEASVLRGVPIYAKGRAVREKMSGTIKGLRAGKYTMWEPEDALTVFVPSGSSLHGGYSGALDGSGTGSRN